MRGFLFGVLFILYTDHKPLVYMHNVKTTKARILRTWNDLSEFDFEVKYRPGKENILADTLSRMHTPNLVLNSDSSGGDLIPDGLQVLKEIEGGGDSLILSLLAVLLNHRGQHDPDLKVPTSDLQLRQLLADEILTNPEYYALNLDKATKQEFKLAKLKGTCPPAQFYLAFSTVFGLQIWVHHGMPYPVVHSKVGERAAVDPSKRVHLQCKAGIHFNPLCENRLFKGNIPLSEDIPERDNSLYEDSDSDDDEPGLNVNFDYIPVQAQSDCQCQNRKSVARVVVGFGNITCCRLVDTSAQVSLLSQRVWNSLSDSERAEAKFTSDVIRIHGLGTEVTKSCGIVYLNVSLADHTIAKVFPFALVHDKYMPFCSILGINLIGSLDLQLHFGSYSFSFISEDGAHRGALVRCREEDLDESAVDGGLCLLQDRLTVEESGQDEEQIDAHAQGLLSRDEVCVIQKRNHTTRLLFSKVKNCVHSSKWSARCLTRFKCYSVQLSVLAGILLYTDNGEAVSVVPFSFLVELLLDLHVRFSHAPWPQQID